MRIILPYDRRYTALVASTVQEFGAMFGADQQDQQRLRLIGEEAFSFILGGIPEQHLDDQFHLELLATAPALVLKFSNHGRPMNVREVPEFSAKDPDKTQDGLSLQLLRQASHHLVFQDLGRQGWQLQIGFVPRGYQMPVPEQPQSANAARDDELLTFHLATPQDAPGIVNLVYDTHRYAYVKSVFYDDIRLAQALADGRLLSVLAKNAAGRVVGHNGIWVESGQQGEAGLSLVEPQFGKGQMFSRLVAMSYREAVSRHPGLLIYLKTVTSSTAGQLFAAQLIPCLLQPSVYRQAVPALAREDGNARESLVLFVTRLPQAQASAKAATQSGAPDVTLYLPAEHTAQLAPVFEALGLLARINPPGDRVLEPATRLHTECHEEKGHAQIHLLGWGADLAQKLRAQTRQLQQDGMATLELLIPAAKPLAGDLDPQLRALGYFFCGIKPMPDGSWQLVYTNLLGQKFAFEALQLYGQATQQWVSYVRQQYQSTP